MSDAYLFASLKPAHYVGRPISYKSQGSTKPLYPLNHRARPPPATRTTPNEERVPLASTLLPNDKRASKAGLLNIFTRSKTPVPGDTITPIPATVESSLKSEETKSPILSSPNKEFASSDSMFSMTMKPPATANSDSKLSEQSSRMSIRSRSNKSVGTAPSVKSSQKSSPKQSPKAPRRSDAAWDPPPLFQAYPQAVRHATLIASTLSADAILRISSHKRNTSGIPNVPLGATEAQAAAVAKKTERSRSKHRRQLSGSISKADWTHKIFVLVTSGYLLQYSGEGSFDRLPEKMMQLSKDSVVFASDVIPGKRWVLQVSQNMDIEGTPAPTSQSLFSRLTSRGLDYRRSATTILLVMNSAEDLESWLGTIRREIESLGGKKHVSETGKAKVDDSVLLLNALPSPRFLVQREHERFSASANPAGEICTSPVSMDDQFNSHWSRSQSTTDADAFANDSAFHTGRGDARSVTTASTSQDGQHLDSLRDSIHRFSYMSSGQRTLITTDGSSPATSPVRDEFQTSDGAHGEAGSKDEVRPRPNALAIADRRRSVQQLQVQDAEYDVYTKSKPLRPRPHSTYGRLGKITPTLNHVPRRSMTDGHHGHIRTLSGKKREIANKNNRRSRLPPPLSTRPLSPVQSISSIDQLALQQFRVAPEEAFPQKMVKTRASMIHLSAPYIGFNGRRHSLIVPGSPSLDQSDFRFARKSTSMQSILTHETDDIVSHEVSLPTPPFIGLSPGQPSPYSPPPRTPLESFIPTAPAGSASLNIYPHTSVFQRAPSPISPVAQAHSPTSYAGFGLSPRPVPSRSDINLHHMNGNHSAAAASYAAKQVSFTPSVRGGLPELTDTIPLPVRRKSRRSSQAPLPPLPVDGSPPRNTIRARKHISAQYAPSATATNPNKASLDRALSPGPFITAQTAQQTPNFSKGHLVLPSMQRVKESAGPKNLMSRRSMPVVSSGKTHIAQLQRGSLSHGPPAAPPPMCALPPIPPPAGSLPPLPAPAPSGALPPLPSKKVPAKYPPLGPVLGMERLEVRV